MEGAEGPLSVDLRKRGQRLARKKPAARDGSFASPRIRG